MSNPLDPIWDAYSTAMDALTVVRQCVSLPTATPSDLFKDTRFQSRPSEDTLGSLAKAQAQLGDQTVLSLFAAFEARIRDHVAEKCAALSTAGLSDPPFWQAISKSLQKYCDQPGSSENLTDLFRSRADPATLDSLASIRQYRNWVAHGRRPPAKTSVVPFHAYDALTSFLKAAKAV